MKISGEDENNQYFEIDRFVKFHFADGVLYAVDEDGMLWSIDLGTYEGLYERTFDINI